MPIISQTAVSAIADHAMGILGLLPPPGPPVISTPAALDLALKAPAPGTVLTLATSLQYPKLLTLPLVPGLVLQSETYTPGLGRIGLADPAPSFQAGVVALSDTHQLLGLELKGTQTIGVLGGTGGIWDRCRLLGDPVLGAHRGIQWSGAMSRVSHCYMDDIFRPDQDTQAIMAWDCDGPGLLVWDCYLSAAGESVMLGGADSTSPARIPRTIRFIHCDFTKKPAWLGTQQVKCALEFKSAIDVIVSDSTFSYAGTSQGQGAYLILATVRNQNGKAPWSCIQGIEIHHCTGQNAAGLVNFLGSDNNHPDATGVLDGFSLHDCQFSNLDGSKGSGRLYQFDRSPAHVHIQNIGVSSSVNISALGYFLGKPSPTGLVLTGQSPLPASKYGWKIDGSAGGGSGHAALLNYMPDAVLDGTVV